MSHLPYSTPSPSANNLVDNTTPSAFTFGPINKNWGDAEMPAATPSASEEEMIITRRRRENTLAARESRRLKREKRQRLEDEVAALRLKVAELRILHAELAMGLPQVYMVTKSQNSSPCDAVGDVEEMDLRFGPKPVLSPNASDIEMKRYHSTLAARRSRARKLKVHRMLKEEAVALRAEVAEFQKRMRAFGAKL
jgi:hypothetical protein